MATITIEVDLPPGMTVTSYERYADGHGFEVAWPLPERCRCDCCGKEEPAHLEYRDRPQVVRDLEVWGQPGFWVYQPPFHRCLWCNHRQFLLPPFKRSDTKYTYRFEQLVLRSLIGSSEEEVARRLGISAETVAFIVRNQLADAQAKQVDPTRVIKDLGIDELSLKKRHRLYVTLLTDLTDPQRPEILAVAKGRDEAAAQKCLERLSSAQRQQVQTYRADMGAAFHAACGPLLPNARPVVDRFHVAKLFNEAIDGQRKKITRAYKAKLSKARRKEFRSWMWEFRRNPQELTSAGRQRLEELFGALPRLRQLYALRVRFKQIFDRADNGRQADRQLWALFLEALEAFPELDSFVRTYERWQEGILNYFAGRQTSGVVEGINNKARVITKRAYGLKSPDSLWTRLILDLNRARDVVSHTIAHLRELVAGFRHVFSGACI